jgi:DNA primase catalytic core
MARIPEAEIERLKKEVSLQRLVEAAGVALSPHGKDLLGLCPFHDDHEPSLVVTPAKNLWHCLGACRAGGSVIDWVMRREKVSFRRAVEVLRDLAGHAPLPVAKGPAAALPLDVDDEELKRRVVSFYHETLKQSPEALSYLERRGLRSAELIDRFQLGYANRTLAYRLPAKNRQAGAEIRGRLQGLGLLRPSGHEHFNGSLVVPVLDEAGAVRGLYGRKIRDDLRPGTPPHLYLPGPHRGVWNVAALSASPEIILCEALIDALTFWAHGFRNVTASYGVNGFTADHLAAFREHGTERVYIAYDRDEAGDKAAGELAETLRGEGIECFRVQFPKGLDANEYARKMSPPAKALDLVLRHAVWLGKGRRPAGPVPPLADPELFVPLLAAAPPPADPDPAVPSAGETTPLDVPGSDRAGAGESGPAAARPEERPEPFLSPPATHPEPTTSIHGDEIVIVRGDRRWRVRGLSKNMSYELLKVNVLVSRGEGFHVDTFDLYSAQRRAAFVKQAAVELGLREDGVKADLGRVLLALEELQDEQIRRALAPKEPAVELTPEERAEALSLLRSPDLLGRILGDFERCGVVGEETNKLVGYLAAVSRKLDKPLAVLIQSSSAAGKSALLEAVLAFVPAEEKVKYSAMTGQSLFYMGETDLRHKVLAIAEEAGAERAAYALKLLQSEGELAIASTGKDPATGRLVTHEYRVQGPVAVFLTTTSIAIDAELQNRCIVLTVDEDRAQTRAIHRRQRELRTQEGYLIKRERERLLKLHRNAQRLLRRLPVFNPYARRLTFLDDKTRTRRDHDKYLDLIEAIALLHQHQRAPRSVAAGGGPVQALDVTPEDIAVANRLAGEVLGRSLDELPPQTRRFLELLEAFVAGRGAALKLDRADVRFSRREVREHTGWSYDQIRVHLDRLVELEYVLTHRGGRGQSFEYELLYDGKGKDGKPFLVGLIDVEALRQDFPAEATTECLGGVEAGLGSADPEFGGPLGGPWGPVGASSGSGPDGPRAAPGEASGEEKAKNPPRTHSGDNGTKPPSYRPAGRSIAAGAAKTEAAFSLAAAAGEGVRR